jgi:hypothetical protein
MHSQFVVDEATLRGTTMKIYEAAEAVLREAGQPMHVRDIHRRIVDQGLFDFRAKDPVSVLNQTLRKKSAHTDTASEHRLFVKTGQSTYGLADWATDR